MNFYTVRDLRTEAKAMIAFNSMIPCRFTSCYDYRMIEEYEKVLRRRFRIFRLRMKVTASFLKWQNSAMLR